MGINIQWDPATAATFDAAALALAGVAQSWNSDMLEVTNFDNAVVALVQDGFTKSHGSRSRSSVQQKVKELITRQSLMDQDSYGRWFHLRAFAERSSLTKRIEAEVS